MSLSLPYPLLLVAAVLVLLTAVLVRLLNRFDPVLQLMKTNYKGDRVPGLGAALWVASVAGYVSMAIVSQHDRRLWAAFALVAFATGLLGLMDDRFGTHQFGGFRGHFGELLKGHLTTGAAKALLIPPAAWLTARLALGQSPWCALLTAFLVSLLANTFNILDMRPARATTAWLLAAGVTVTASSLASQDIRPLLLMIGPVLVYFPADVEVHGMLGDTGANLLGAILGLQIALAAPVWLQLLLAALFLYVQVYGEEHRRTPGIIDSPWLKWLDLFTK